MNKHTLRAGIARSDITADRPAAEINDPLYARALVLDDGDVRLAIVTMDVTAIGARKISDNMLPDVGEAFLPELRARAEAELGIPGCNVLVNASHTHPPGRMLCDDQEQVERTFDALRRAQESLTPVKVGTGAGSEARIIMNRTLRLKNGRHWTIRHTNPCPWDGEVAGVGPIDPEIGILRIDRLDNTPLAVVYNYACHLLAGVPFGRITANIPGFASKVIEENLGHGAMAMFLQGAAGDIVDISFKNVNQPCDNEPLGRMLGLSVLDAVRKIRTNESGLNIASRLLKLPRRADIPERVRELEDERGDLLAVLRGTSLNFKTFVPLYLRYLLDTEHPMDYAWRYQRHKHTGSDALAGIDARNRKDVAKYLANIRAMEKLARIQDKITTLQKHGRINAQSGETTIDAEVMALRIGEYVLVTTPAEMLCRVGLNLKQASPHPHTFIAAFSNGYIHYSPPADYYDKGGYEVTECLLAPEWERIFMAGALELVSEL